jgi:uncharacterized protein (DUF1697 family)
MPVQVVLLRGINVGSSRRVAMADLRDLLTGLGYENVRTLLQSGNVVLETPLAAEELARTLERQIADGLGVDPAVVVRSRDELAAVVERNPLGDVADDPKRHAVHFLSGEPDAEAVTAIEQADLAPEAGAASVRELYTWHPDGLQNSTLAKLVAKAPLGVTVTNRNWNTVTKLLALADS